MERASHQSSNQKLIFLKHLLKISKVKSDGGKIVKSSNINILESIKQKVISVDTILKVLF